jgi:hypothetical protein
MSHARRRSISKIEKRITPNASHEINIVGDVTRERKEAAGTCVRNAGIISPNIGRRIEIDF